ncbi:MAG: hypothetical protein ACR2NP_22765, partial [Pirellulaceae bacterium]
MKQSIIVRMLPVAAVLLVFSQSAQCQETAEEKINAVRALMRSTNLPPEVRNEIVVNKLNEILAEDAENQTAKNLLAQIFVATGKEEQAVTLFRELFEVEPGYYTFLDRLLRKTERETEADEILRQALSRYRTNLDEVTGKDEPDLRTELQILMSMADCHVLLGEYEQAEELLQKPLDSSEDPRFRKALESSLSRVLMTDARSLLPQIQESEDVRARFMELVRKAHEYDPANPLVQIELTRYAVSEFPDAEAAREMYDARESPNQA